MTRDRAALAGAALVGLTALPALLAPLLVHVDPNAVDTLNRLAAPTLQHPLGTDYLGRDELTRLLHGARLSLLLVITASAATSLLGLVLGVASAAYGGAVDQAVMRVVDGLQALPGLVLALAVLGLLGPGEANLLVAIIAAWWTGYARLVRSLALSALGRPYVEAVRSIGARRARILIRHVVPNVIGPAIVLTTLDMGRILLAIAGLSFLGLGPRPPTPEWGSMLAEARPYFDEAPALVLLPGVAISLLALGFNLVGDGLRDLLDPRLRTEASG
jgi:peptide/nickel transport system permease protein